MKHSQRHGHLSRNAIYTLGCVCIGIVAFYGFILILLLLPTTSSSSRGIISLPPAPQPLSLSSKILFTGNVYWGRYINQRASKSGIGTAFPFARLGEFDRDSYQAWIGGLECPTNPGVSLTAAEEEATLSFHCSPDYLPEVAKWFSAFTLANNHTDNQGTEGFEATKKELDKNKIQYFGHYDPRELNDLCNIISIDTITIYEDSSKGRAKIPVALCGYHGVFRIPQPESLSVMKRYAALMPVIAMPHSGAEYKPEPDQLKTDLYRAMIDNGADMVIGDHPHWVQTTEAYKGKLIVYSMGNFMFDQQSNKEVVRSAAIELQLSAKGSPELLRTWSRLAEDCTAYADSCLEQAEKLRLKRLAFDYTFKPVGTSNTGYQTHRASESEQKEIEQRLQWDLTMKKLSGT